MRCDFSAHFDYTANDVRVKIDKKSTVRNLADWTDMAKKIEDTKGGKKIRDTVTGQLVGSVADAGKVAPTPSRGAKKPTAKEDKAPSKTLSSWNPPVDIDAIRIGIWNEMRKANTSDFDPRELTQRLAKAILPDLGGATTKQLDVLLKRIRSFKNLELNRIAWIVEDEKEMRVDGDRGTPGIAKLVGAENRLEESLRDQNAGYSATDIIHVRLKEVQEDLADPTCWNVTVKPPSGYEIAVSKPDARAILLSMGIQPAKTRPFVSLWAR